MAKKNDYDVVIIGAGIGGLVCGCYLAKAGIKTLIVEKNTKVGGYCTSFIKKGLVFDTCVHSLGSCRPEANINKVLLELEIESKLSLRIFDPSDVIITPKGKVVFWHDLNKTIKSFEKIFPEQKKKIEKFFNDVVNVNSKRIIALRDKSFLDFLNFYFKDEIIKGVLAFPLLGNMGLSASKASAFSAIKLYQEFMLDGGYSFEGGMQKFPDILAEKFQKLGGKILLKCTVKEIIVADNVARGIKTKQGSLNFSSKYIVSNVDAVQTFLNLAVKSKLDFSFVNKISSLQSSLSMFIVYLGLKDDLIEESKVGTNEWYLPSYDVDKLYKNALRRKVENISEYMIHFFSRRHMAVFTNASFNDKDYWVDYKKDYGNKIVKKMEKHIPGLIKNIDFRAEATPYVLYRTTLNLKGAAYGWEQTFAQFAEQGLSQTTPIKNLFLTGHWTTLAQGVGGVVYLGKDTARIITRKAGK